MMARAGYAVNIPSHVLIPKESIKAYFTEIAKEFDIHTVKGLDAYIASKLQ